jgi:iron complex transport system substrate-binding protein
VLADIDGYFASEAEANPEFAGKTFAGVWDGDGFVYVYTAADSRIEVLTELGLEVAPSVAELDTSDGGFFYELSYEQLDQLDADVIVSYHSSKDEADAFLAKPELQAIPAVAAGNVAQVYDPVTVSSVSPPTALSFDWEGGLPALVEAIAGVVEQ